MKWDRRNDEDYKNLLGKREFGVLRTAREDARPTGRTPQTYGVVYQAFRRFGGRFWLESRVIAGNDGGLIDMPLQRYNLNIFTKGWFVGNFSPTLINSDDVEVAVKHYKA